MASSSWVKSCQRRRNQENCTGFFSIMSYSLSSVNTAEMTTAYFKAQRLSKETCRGAGAIAAVAGGVKS